MHVVGIGASVVGQGIDTCGGEVHAVLTQGDTDVVSIEIGGNQVGQAIFVEVDDNRKNGRDT